jgi:hypothetical protein
LPLLNSQYAPVFLENRRAEHRLVS